MKKLFTIAALVFAVSAMTSCKKDYTCECKVTTAGITATSSSTINDTKANAEEACDKGDATTTVGGVSSTSECSIK